MKVEITKVRPSEHQEGAIFYGAVDVTVKTPGGSFEATLVKNPMNLVGVVNHLEGKSVFPRYQAPANWDIDFDSWLDEAGVDYFTELEITEAEELVETIVSATNARVIEKGLDL